MSTTASKTGGNADLPQAISQGSDGRSRIQVVMTDGDGNPVSAGGGGGGGASGSVTAAGVNGTSAQAVQGITGGVPMPVTGSVTSASNITTKFREAFENYQPNTGGKWVQTMGPGEDIIAVDGNALSASYLVISKCPLTPGSVSMVETVDTFGMPIEMSAGISFSQRTLGQEFAVEIVDVDTPITPPADMAIASIQQTTTTLTITTAAPHGYYPGARVGIRDCLDSRVNYPSLVVATAPTPTTMTLTAGPGGTIPSLSAGPSTSGFLYARSALGYAQNGTSQIFESTNTSNASFYIRSESGDVLPSGTVNGNHSVTIAGLGRVQPVNTPRTYAFQPTSEFRLALQADRVQWYDSPVDSVAQATNRAMRTQVIPDPANTYKFRIRATNNKALTVPVGRIVTAVKTGSTTATITTDVPHGLTVADQIVVYGIRDQAAASFPNLTTATAVASIVSPTQFTVVIGTASTVTSYGGFVARVNGGNLGSALGYSAVIAQSAVLASGVLTLTGNTNWSGILIGDYINVHGCGNAVDGASLGVDGPWRVRDVATTTLVLEPIGSTVPPADFGATNCGGGVIKRTDMLVSFVRIFDFDRLRVESLPRPSGDIASSAPVVVQNTVPVSGSVTATVASTTVAGTVAVDSAIGNPVTIGLRASNANVAAMSAAGDNVGAIATMIGVQVTKPYALPEAGFNTTLALTTATATAIQAAAGAGIKRHLTAVQAINTGAAVVDLIILDGATERWRLPLPINVPVLIQFPTEIVTTANAAINANLSAAGTVRANFQGYTAP